LIAYLKEELLLVLGTSSSEAALPSLMQKLERAGAKRSVVGLVVPTGYSFNLDGTNIYMTLATLFIAQALGVDLSFQQQVTILIVAMLTSKGASGITGASPIWNKIIILLLKDRPEHKFPKPENLIEVQVCTLTGQLACSGCPTRTEYFLPGTEPKIACKPEYIQQLIEQKKQQEERDKILTGTSANNL